MTAETAMVLPSLIALTVVLVWLIAVAAAQLRCLDAAREGVRAVARGESADAGQAIAAAVAPTDAEIVVSRRADTVRVRVVARAEAPGWLGDRLPALTVSGSAVGLVEEP